MDTNMIDWIFSGIGLTVVSTIYFFLTNRKKKNIIRDIENEIHQKDDSQNRLKVAIKEFNSYVPTDIYFYNNYLGERTYTIKKFREELKYNEIFPKLNIIFGDAGSGKSILMTYLCYSYCKYHSLEQRKKHNNLYDRGVIYVRLLHFRNMEQLMSRLRNDFSKFSNINFLILDGLDEFREINDKKAEDLIISIFDQLETENFLNSLKQVYITSRKEPFNDISNSFIPNLVYQSNRPRIGEICLTTSKQILKIYTRQGLRKYKRKLKKFISEQEHTIFEIPFFIQYADIILKNTNQQNIIKEDALIIIIEKWIENEWIKYWTKYSHSYKNQDKQSINLEYKIFVYICLYRYASYLIMNDEYELSINSMDEITKDLNSSRMFDSAFYILTRNLMHKTNDKYSFIHFNFYEFIVTKTLVENFSISSEIKAKMFRNNKQLRNIYIYHIESLVNSKNLTSYLLSNEEKDQFSKLKNFDISSLYEQKKLDITDFDISNISMFLKIFHNIKRLKYYHYNLNYDKISLIRNKNIFKLKIFDNEDEITSLKYLENFGNIETLDLGNMRIKKEDIEILSKIRLKVLKFSLNFQEKELVIKLNDMQNIDKFYIINIINPDDILFIYDMWKNNRNIHFDLENTQHIADRIYYNINLTLESKLTILKVMYILCLKGIFVENDDKYIYVDVGNYLVNLLIDNNNVDEAKHLAKQLIAKENDDFIRECPIKIYDNIMPKYAHMDLIFTLGELSLRNFDYNNSYILFQRSLSIRNRTFNNNGYYHYIRGSYGLIGERDDEHYFLAYGISACLIGAYDIAIQYLSRIEKIGYYYFPFCSRFFLAKSFLSLNDIESAKEMLQKCNDIFIMENKYSQVNYNVEIRTVIIKIIEDNATIYNIEISYISKILCGKVLAVMFQDYDTASKFFSEGINEMSNLYGIEDDNVIKEKENIKLFLGKKFVWKDFKPGDELYEYDYEFYKEL